MEPETPGQFPTTTQLNDINPGQSLSFPKAQLGFWHSPVWTETTRPTGVAKKPWEHQPSLHFSVIEHVEQMHSRNAQVWPLVREHMQKAQEAQALIYN